eukprot:324102_1
MAEYEYNLSDTNTEQYVTSNIWIIPVILTVESFILLAHVYAFTLLTKYEKLMWAFGYLLLQVFIGYLLSIHYVPLIILYVLELTYAIQFESKMDAEKQDHFSILFLELNVYLWIIFGHDTLIAVIIPIICELLIATSNTDSNAFHVRSVTTYSLVKLCAWIQIKRFHAWNIVIFGVYFLVPIGMVLIYSKTKLLTKFCFEHWMIYASFHILFWSYFCLYL